MPIPNEPIPVPVKTGTINLKNWKVRYRNPDGSISTIKSMSFSDDSGLEILIPTFSPDGKKLNEKQAINQYYATGKHLGKFKNSTDATIYADFLHKNEEKKINKEKQSKLKIKQVGK